jgi:hypothetical protein
MKLPLYVCANCGQTFTRRSGAVRHNSNLHFNRGIIVQMLEYIIGRCSGRFLPPNQLINRRFRRPTFIRNQKMDNPDSGFKATMHDKSCGIKSNMLNKLNTQQFVNGDTFTESNDHTSDRLSPNKPYDEFSRVSMLAVIKRLLLRRFGPSASLDRHMRILAHFSFDPEYKNALNEYLAWLGRFCRYYDDLMQLAN